MTEYGPKILTSGLILALDAANSKSYSNSSVNWHDLTGNWNDGILTNGPVFSTSNNGVISFDGLNDYLAGSTTLASNINDQLTLISTVRVVDLTQRCVIFSKYQGSTPYGYVLEIGTLGGYMTKSLRFYAQGTSANSCDYRGTDTLIDNQIYIITVTFNTTSQKVKMYYNNIVMSATQASDMLTGSDWSQGTNKFSLASYLPVYSIGGPILIYNTYLYNRELSADEISQNYNALKSRFNLSWVN